MGYSQFPAVLWVLAVQQAAFGAMYGEKTVPTGMFIDHLEAQLKLPSFPQVGSSSLRGLDSTIQLQSLGQWDSYGSGMA